MTVETKLAPVPPLSQSLQGDLACAAGYAARHVEGRRTPSTPEQARGIDIHAAIADYIRHLVQAKRSVDYDYLRGLIASATPEAAEVLEPFLEAYEFNPDSVAGVELRLAVDLDWHPVEPRTSGEAFAGTLDLLTLPEPGEAGAGKIVAHVDDWKSYFQIVDPDTFQAKLYPLLAFLHLPEVDEVVFSLHFPRYVVRLADGSVRPVSRSKVWHREDVPALKQAVLRERARQLDLHARAESGERFPATPGRHCYGCPLLASGCPMGDLNPYDPSTPAEQRVAHLVWLKQAIAHEEKLVRDAVALSGPVRYTDANGNVHEAGFVAVTKHSYPLAASLPVLENWKQQSKEDLAGKLTVGGLSSLLKAKKRSALAAEMAPVAEAKPETQFKIRRIDEKDEEE